MRFMGQTPSDLERTSLRERKPVRGQARQDEGRWPFDLLLVPEVEQFPCCQAGLLAGHVGVKPSHGEPRGLTVLILVVAGPLSNCTIPSCVKGHLTLH